MVLGQGADQWIGIERRSRADRRAACSRRVDFEKRKRLGESTESESDSQVIPSEQWDRRSGQDRRGHPLYVRNSG